MSEILGVVARMRFHAVDEMAPLPLIYCPLGQAQRTSLTLFVRSASGLASLQRPIRDAVASIDLNQPVYDTRPMFDRVQETWGKQRLLSFFFSPDSRLRSRPSVCTDYSPIPRSNVSVKSASVSRSARVRPRFARSFF